MHLAELFPPERKTLSFEFFPPRAQESLEDTLALIADLHRLSPDFMTVTYGAGGGTRDLTKQIVSFIHNKLNTPAVAHLTCVGHSADEIAAIVKNLDSEGIKNILALRGDPPKGADRFEPHPEGFQNAFELTSFIKTRGDFHVMVAGYPETHRDAASPEADIDYLKSKVDAGAECIITQLFFEADVYFNFVERAHRAGITVPIVPGIMPVRNVAQLKRFTSMCGASIPDALRAQLEEIEDDSKAVRAFGIDYAVRLIEELFEGGAPGLHLYTLNRSAQARPIVEALHSYFHPELTSSGAMQRPA